MAGLAALCKMKSRALGDLKPRDGTIGICLDPFQPETAQAPAPAGVFLFFRAGGTTTEVVYPTCAFSMVYWLYE